MTASHEYIDLVFDNGTLRRFTDGRPEEWKPKRTSGTQKPAGRHAGRGGRGDLKAAFRGGETGGRPT